MYERVNFTTTDGVKISGDYYGVQTPKGHVLLIHMMPAVKESWQGLAKALNEADLAALAIDSRGHGESVHKIDGTVLNYNNFSDVEQQAKINDVRAAVDFLTQAKGAKPERLALVGASIGANLALQYLTENPEVPTAVLLSPGLDFRGVKTDILVKRLGEGQSFLCAAGLNDKYSFDSCRELEQLTPTGAREFLQLGDVGHGTHMFSSQPDLMAKIVEWVSGKIGR